MNDRKKYIGLHPNFFNNSTHGNKYDEIINHCQKLWPESNYFRSHGFFENSEIIFEFKKRGFLFDSNICLFLQPFCTPLIHASGLIRFPVFWEDDVHTFRELSLHFDKCKKHFQVPGLKVINVHPLNFTINNPSTQYYIKHKFLYKIRDESWKKSIYEGLGELNFINELTDLIFKNNFKCPYLFDIYNFTKEKG